MLPPILARYVSRLRRVRSQKPLISHARDLDLIRAVHNTRFPTWRQLRYVGRLLQPWERRVIRWCVIVAAVAMLWFGVQFVQAHREALPAVGGQYTEAVVGSPQLINPVFASLNDVDVDLTRLLFSGLMRYDDRQQLVVDLAERYEVSEDKKTYTFWLLPNARWHDGEPVTADDVVFTIDRIQNVTVNSPLLVSFQGVTVKAIDERTVQFTLQEPFVPFLSALTVGILPEHIWFDIAAERMHLHKANLQPVGSGPFMFAKLAKDETGYIYRYELRRNPDFYRQPPYLDVIIFRFFAEYDGPAGAIQAIREQRVDGLNFVPKDLRDRVERKHITLHTLQLPQYTSLFLNKDGDPALKELDVRLALAHALDKERIVREVIKGEGYVIHSPILPGFPGYSPEVPKLSYDIQKANELLDGQWSRISADEYRALRKAELLQENEAGIASSTVSVAQSAPVTSTPILTTEAATTTATSSAQVQQEAAIDRLLDTQLHPAQTFYRKNKDGIVLTLKLVTADTKEYSKAAELIAGFWEEVGVRTEIELVAPKNITRTSLKDRDYDVLLYGVIIGSDPDQYPFWHSSQIDFPWLNLSRYVNRAVDTLLEQARETTDEEKQIEFYQKFQELILADRPAIFLYTPTYTYATNDAIKGIDVVRIFHPADRFANITEWYMKTKGEWK